MEVPSEILEKLKELKAQKIFLQFPEGLKLKVQKIVKELEAEGFEVFVCLEKCFGACDVRENEAKLLGCDCILHIGHEEFIKTEFPVVYWEYFINSEVEPILEKEFWKLENFKKIGLITSVQFVNLIPKVESFLRERGKEVFTSKALQYPGQVLGCDLRAAKSIEKEVDCFLAISAGEFYAAGLVFQTNKPVFNLDLEKREIKSLEEFKKKTQKIIAWNKAQFKDAKKVGLLISWKKGQFKSPFELKKKLEAKGKEVFLLAMDEISPEKLEGLDLDFLINLACPRIGIDDLPRYKIPVLNYQEIEGEI